MRSKEQPQSSFSTAPDNTFGLGIQVYKIESMLPRINSNTGKNQRRQLIKQLENPAQRKKYQKIQKQRIEKTEKNHNISYDKINQKDKDDRIVKDPNQSIRRRSIINTRSNTMNKLILKQKPERPPSVKIPSSATAKKQITPTSKQVRTADNPLLNQTQQKLAYIKVFPPFENQEIKSLEDKITQVASKRLQTKKNLRKQLRLCRDQTQQERILKRLQLIDRTDIVEQIVNLQELSPYQTNDQFQSFGLEQYILRQKGKYEIVSDDEDCEPVYRPTIHVSEEQQQSERVEQERRGTNSQQNIEKQQSTRNQQ